MSPSMQPNLMEPVVTAASAAEDRPLPAEREQRRAPPQQQRHHGSQPPCCTARLRRAMCNARSARRRMRVGKSRARATPTTSKQKCTQQLPLQPTMFTDHVQWFGIGCSAGGFIAALTHGDVNTCCFGVAMAIASCLSAAAACKPHQRMMCPQLSSRRWLFQSSHKQFVCVAWNLTARKQRRPRRLVLIASICIRIRSAASL
jgi:hypothetical protein